jgi:hypothetical protein
MRRSTADYLIFVLFYVDAFLVASIFDRGLSLLSGMFFCYVLFVGMYSLWSKVSFTHFLQSKVREFKYTSLLKMPLLSIDSIAQTWKDETTTLSKLSALVWALSFLLIIPPFTIHYEIVRRDMLRKQPSLNPAPEFLGCTIVGPNQRMEISICRIELEEPSIDYCW